MFSVVKFPLSVPPACKRWKASPLVALNAPKWLMFAVAPLWILILPLTLMASYSVPRRRPPSSKLVVLAPDSVRSPVMLNRPRDAPGDKMPWLIRPKPVPKVSVPLPPTVPLLVILRLPKLMMEPAPANRVPALGLKVKPDPKLTLPPLTASIVPLLLPLPPLALMVMV